MNTRQRPSIIRHLMLTLLLSCGFVKAADALDVEAANHIDEIVSADKPVMLPILPCSKFK
jgi:hypothetical protein